MTEPTPIRPPDDEMRAFLLVVREGLLVIVRYIERRYRLPRS